MADKEPPKRVHERRVPYQPWFLSGSLSAHETLPPAEQTIRAKLSENFREDPSQKQPGSSSAIRVPQKEQHFGKISSIPQKEGLSKVCQKFEKIYAAHSAEKTTFSRYDAKKRSVPQKESFSSLLKT